MFLKYLQFFVLNLFFLHYGRTTETCDLNEFYQFFFNHIESLKKSVEILNARLDIRGYGYSSGSGSESKTEKIIDKRGESVNKTSPAIFDIRYDNWPKHCETELVASTCAQATACTHSSGIYNITVTRCSNKPLTAYCDNDNFKGDWLYILRRQDGSVNFSRSWLEYVEGFGDVAGEYWIGLENLYALTNFNGPQELLVFLESFDGRQVVASYDNFVVGHADEKYKLKSLGRYSGTAGDSLHFQLGAPFSTYDNDNDATPNRNCAKDRFGGFWFNDCTKANPTGKYLRGTYTKLHEGSYWKTFIGENYSQKTIIFMIRRQRPMLVNSNKEDLKI